MPTRVSATIALGSDGRPLEDGFRDGNGMPADGTEAVFPIIQILEGQTRWCPIGTGFFISNNGLFATASHVLRDAHGRPLESLFGVHISRANGTVTVREIQKTVYHPQADIAIGFLFDKELRERRIQTVNKCFLLTKTLPRVGDTVVSFAFPSASVDSIGDKHRIVMASSVSRGTFEEHHPAGRDSVLLPGPCIRTSMPLAAGASGGPVAFGNGAVFGINSTGYDGTDLSFLTPTAALLELTVKNVQLPDGSIREHIGLSDLTALGLIPFQ